MSYLQTILTMAIGCLLAMPSQSQSWASAPASGMSLAQPSTIRFTGTVPVLEDTFVLDWAGSPSPGPENDKSGLLLVAKSDVTPRRSISYLRFDFNNLPISTLFSKAILRIKTVEHCQPHHLDGVSQFGVHVVQDRWSIASLDGNYIPNYGPTIDTQYPQRVPLGSWTEWDVTRGLHDQAELARANGFAIDVDDDIKRHADCIFASSESQAPPELILTVSGNILLLPAVLNLSGV